MTALGNAQAVAAGVVGTGPVSKATGTITGNPTTSLFTVTGTVKITELWGVVDTALTTDSGTYAIQHDPSGSVDTRVIVTATDLGTSDTAAGSVIGLTRGTTAAPAFLRGGTSELGAVVNDGAVQFVGAASANGAITFYCRYVPLTSGATVVAV